MDVAADGREGLWLATENAYGAIVAEDVVLPGLDGIGVCQRLREAGIWVPVLMLTARGGVGDRVPGARRGRGRLPGRPFACSSWPRGCARWPGGTTGPGR